MKSEHRHHLAENDLSKILAKWGEEFDKHANTILTVLIVVTLMAAGIIYWTKTSASTNALGWTDLAKADSVEKLQNVAEEYPGTPVALWATLRAADGFLQEGIRLSLTDRPASNERLSQAQDSYEALLNNSGAPKEIREQVLMGYALTLETLSDGDTSAAVAAYEKLLAEFEKTRFTTFAQDRIAELKTGGSQDFYAWFHRLNPKPADIPLPQDQAKILGANDLTNPRSELGGSGLPETAPFVVPKPDGDKAAKGDAAKKDINPFAKKEEEMKEKAEAEKAEADKPAKPPADKPETEPADKPDSTEEKPAKSSETPESKPDESTPEKPSTEEAAKPEPETSE